MANALYVLAWILIIIAALTNAEKPRKSYCELESCSPDRHTHCQYTPLRINSRCGKVYSSAMTQDEIEEVLQIHNTLRAHVACGCETRGIAGSQPAATNLGPLEWDEELAEIAQTWADQCEFGHDECRDTERFEVGQNVGYEATSGPFEMTQLTQLVIDWYDEVERFDINEVSHFTDSGDNTGHYSQLVWAKSTHLGCGLIRYKSYETNAMNTTYLVCNYGPSGNWIGQPVYEMD